MSEITEKFFDRSKIERSGAEDVMDFLSQPESVNRMISVSEIGLPALAGVVKELEERFGNCKSFPLDHNAKNSNAPNRRNVGWMVRFVMGSYGYAPVAGGLPDADDHLERTRAGLKFSGAKYFDTSAIYARTTSYPDYAIKVLDSKKYDLLIDAMKLIKDIAHNSVVTQ